ncbi:alcohol dehydrogenase catalytic domain-containing protein [Paracoccus kondratievae]|uniref:NADP-dependent oxidoreductase n=1 Tax=Paracoccus kondratievae TaxID=135740 RepID=UPI001266378B|nr:NADP-dependent oxidoreductase [Paracoccus kondratievae]QFQ89070.1 alcohol dehydrogenase catalytic domain-containing protein [Paracoccus kondratievae]
MSNQFAENPISGKAITYRQSGGPEVISIVDRQVRAPREHEIRIAVVAAGVNPTDIQLRDPGFPGQAYPVVPGMDAAGIVESIGSAVSRFRVGDRVMAVLLPTRPEGGAQAEYVVVPEASAAVIPDHLSFAGAATLPMNGLTALLALDLAGLSTGETLAVSGGAGLLASYIIPIARSRGLQVIADARSEAVDQIRSYGADIVIERSLDFAERVRDHFPRGVDAMIDTAVLGVPALGAVRDCGTYIPLRGWESDVHERDIGIKPAFVFHALQRTDWLELIRNLVQSGTIPLRAVSEYPPENIAGAQEAILAGSGKHRPVILFRTDVR